MTVELAYSLAMAGGYAAVALAAVGSAMGSGIAGQAAIAAWKRCYAQNKPAPFLLVALAGTPLSQTIYGMILMMLIKGGIPGPNGGYIIVRPTNMQPRARKFEGELVAN